MLSVVHRLFVPHHSNNHRSKILHNKSLLALFLCIVIVATINIVIRKELPDVLGVATNINVADLLNDTNQKRAENGGQPLTLNQKLIDAANAKATDMFAKNYWAHNAPDGTTPWVFIQHVNYNYSFAGENLARSFQTSQGVVEAWMNSPSHKENLLNKNYSEVGFAVVNGKLSGEDTTLVVQMFGRPQSGPAAVPQAAAKAPIAFKQPLPVTNTQPQPPAHPVVQTRQIVQLPPQLIKSSLVAGISNQPLIDSTVVTRRIAISTLLVLIVAFVLDFVYIERQKLFRMVGHNLDHVIFLSCMLILLILFGRGVIL